MDPNKLKHYEVLATDVLKKFKMRGFEGYYCSTKEEARDKVLSLMKKGSSVTWGGSETLKQIGIFDAMKKDDYVLYDRSTAKTPEEQRAFYGKAVTADYFLMSSNAITQDGQLINIDGNGNRVACLICGPQNVIVVASMNKITKDVESGIQRTRDMAAPPNAFRLGVKTPCEKIGRCADCLDDACMCCEVVVTRKSRVKNRIKVILVGEELGY